MFCMTLVELYEHFKNKAHRERCEKTKDASSSRQTASYFGGGDGVDLEDDFAKFLEQRGQGVSKTEVEVYLSDGMEKRVENFQILNWWKLNSIKFPVLSQVARHVLAMPISSVASESAFSIGGRVIDTTRSSLTEKSAEALICTQDWIRSSPIDIQFKNMTAAYQEELIERLENIELDEFDIDEVVANVMDDE